MNIAFVLSYLSDRFGGPVTVSKCLGGVLAEKGHNVSYWATTGRDAHAVSNSLPGSHIYETCWPRGWCRSPGLAKGLSDGFPRVDIVHINEFWPYPIYISSKIAHRHDVPYILSPSGSLEPWALRSTRLKWFKKMAYLRVIGRSIMSRSACLHACSAQEAEHFRQVGYDGPITIIPNGVDLSNFAGIDGRDAEIHWPNLKDRPVVLFMSRLSPEKGLDLLIRVWAELGRFPACKDAILVIAGPDYRGYQKHVEAMLKSHALGSRVLMVGMVRGCQKSALLHRANVFVLPSYSENFGIVVAEALACGTPVVTTTATPWQQLEEIDAGRWVPPRESELAQALTDLLSMPPSKRAAMGGRGRGLIENNYTWDRLADKFVHVYDCILSGKTVPLHPEPYP